jgi:phosphoribosylformylglycinamidine synthase
VKEEPRLAMRWNGKKIVDISRAFLDTNGASKHIEVSVAAPQDCRKAVSGGFADNMRALVNDLNCCSKRGLAERFDSTIGAGTVLMPWGGKYQLTPAQAMVQKISMEKKHTDDCSFMSWGYNPYLTEQSPYHGAYTAVVESVSKLIASGAAYKDVYLTFQEYFERLGSDPERWGKPLSALLGAFRAQLELGVGAIGGKDSMSGSFEDIHVPPTLVSFAVTTGKVSDVVSPEFKAPGHKVIRLAPEYGADHLPVADSLLKVFAQVTELLRSGKATACFTPVIGGDAEAVMKMCFGNGIGFAFDPGIDPASLFRWDYGAFILEVTQDVPGQLLGYTTDDGTVSFGEEKIALSELCGL